MHHLCIMLSRFQGTMAEPLFEGDRVDSRSWRAGSSVHGLTITLPEITARSACSDPLKGGAVFSFIELSFMDGIQESYGGREWCGVVEVDQLRKEIEDDPAHPTYILTESYIGYRFREA